MSLSVDDLAVLTAFRRHLHQRPEVSGQEAQTAREVLAFLQPHGPDRVISGLGGHGLAVVYEGHEPGPTLLLRCELDGLPITEISTFAHRSQIPGKGHLCGHDGHMATLAGVAMVLGRQRPKRGRVVLMFQPAEEDGSGAAAVIADPAFAEIRPDMSFSWHNMPGVPLGQALLKAGPVACASRGMRVVFEGRTAHASLPETGISPMMALSRLMPALTALSFGDSHGGEFRLVTVTHAIMGVPAFGIAPGAGEIWATLRTLTDDQMAVLALAAQKLVGETAQENNLSVAISWHDDFAHSANDPAAVAVLAEALEAEGIAHRPGDLPMRGSEDFGRFGHGAPAAMAFLGAGETCPPIHNPDYDFPDALIDIGTRMYLRILRNLLG